MSRQMPGRSPQQCRARWARLKAAGGGAVSVGAEHRIGRRMAEHEPHKTKVGAIQLPAARFVACWTEARALLVNQAGLSCLRAEAGTEQGQLLYYCAWLHAHATWQASVNAHSSGSRA